MLRSLCSLPPAGGSLRLLSLRTEHDVEDVTVVQVQDYDRVDAGRDYLTAALATRRGPLLERSDRLTLCAIASPVHQRQTSPGARATSPAPAHDGPSSATSSPHRSHTTFQLRFDRTMRRSLTMPTPAPRCLQERRPHPRETTGGARGPEPPGGRPSPRRVGGAQARTDRSPRARAGTA